MPSACLYQIPGEVRTEVLYHVYRQDSGPGYQWIALWAEQMSSNLNSNGFSRCSPIINCYRNNRIAWWICQDDGRQNRCADQCVCKLVQPANTSQHSYLKHGQPQIVHAFMHWLCESVVRYHQAVCKTHLIPSCWLHVQRVSFMVFLQTVAQDKHLNGMQNYPTDHHPMTCHSNCGFR